jgi:hypothetical protein
MQEHLFDTIRKYDVNFTKIELKRWSEPQFLEYGKNRGIKNISELYKKVCERLTPNHALLTRAVLVKRLLDMAENSSLDDLLERLDKSGTDFFSVFVKSIIEREANEKWIDRSGQNEVGTPLLTIEEHCRLLSLISLNMWESRIEYLKSDTFELVIEIFSDEVRKKPHQIKQIQERIKGHALLVVSPSVLDAIQFDHDEFRLFFLGEAIAQQISSQTEQTKKDIWNIFRRGILPLPAQQSFIRSLSRNHQLVYSQIIHLLLDVAAMDIQTSYTHQNCTDVISHLISNRNSSDELKITKMIFNNDALRDKKISNIVFDNCYFLPSSLEITTLNKCSFINCRFDELRIFKSTKIENIVFKDSKVECLQLYEKDSIWNPMEIQMHLKNLGISMPESDNQESISEQQNEPDPNLYNMEKLLRYFMRSTHIGEHVIVMKLGGQGQAFINDAIPQLLKYGVMEEIENRGGDNQRRFRLGVSLHTIRNAIFCAKGSFNVFLQHIETKEISSS